MKAEQWESQRLSFVGRVLIVLGLASVFVIAGALLYSAPDVFLLVFAAILFAVLLDTAADFLGRGLSIPRWLALLAVCLLFIALIVGGGWLLGTQFADQFNQLAQTLQSSWARVQSHLREYQWGRQMLEGTFLGDLVSNPSAFLSRITGLVSTALSGLTSLIIILILGVYLAASPAMYRNGVISLFPIKARPRAGQVLDAAGDTLRWWLLGRLVTMTVVGLLTAVGLWLLNIPLVLPLAIIAFLFAFVPYLGPILSAVPAILVGMTASGGAINGLYVALLYIGIQSLESYLIQPLVERRAVSMPPALLLTSQVLLGVLLGTMGIILASPLAAVGLLLVKKAYVEDTLGDRL